ncbi:hypothetical protein [Arthrobacter yangruifuii]|uniref:hypothetical protein n=1 Tax=Arthrobacter yangruifuii TaxID=2606616 RepID=UPI0011B3AF8A|nr:hypothetical protein [Arthrobacter yangruifuii]
MATRTPLWATGCALLALTITGCAGDSNDGNGSSATPSETASPSIPGKTANPDRCGQFTASPTPGGIIVGTFGPYCEEAVATTYTTALIPDESSAIVTVEETDADTTVQLQAQGFAVNMSYSARLHEDNCGAEPADAGAEYQSGQDPLVLDFTTDASGNATASATVPWVAPDDDVESLLILGAGDAAGQPAGCINLAP